MRYRSGYKYQLTQDTAATTEITDHEVETPYIKLHIDGVIVILEGYAWDGPSGPTIDTRSFMRGSLVHDALYQLLREGHLPPAYRLEADRTLRKICRQDGMSRIRSTWVYLAVRAFGKLSADPMRRKAELQAP